MVTGKYGWATQRLIPFSGIHGYSHNPLTFPFKGTHAVLAMQMAR